MEFLSHPNLPTATLTSGRQVQDAQQGSFCWTSGSGGSEVGASSGSCGDAAGVTVPDEAIDVPRGTKITLASDAERVEAAYATQATPGGALDYLRDLDFSRGSDVVDLPPGTYVIDVYATFDRGDSTFDFSIRVS
jgi:hypothetical protein